MRQVPSRHLLPVMFAVLLCSLPASLRLPSACFSRPLAGLRVPFPSLS